MAKPPPRCLTTGSAATQPADSQMPLNSSLENHCRVFHPRMGWHFFLHFYFWPCWHFFFPPVLHRAVCTAFSGRGLLPKKLIPSCMRQIPLLWGAAVLHRKVLCFPLSAPHSAGRWQPRQGMLWCCTIPFSKGPVCTATLSLNHRGQLNNRTRASNWWLLGSGLGFFFPPTRI